MQDFQIEIKYLKRSRRATLRVLPGKLIRVTAPFRLSEEEIKNFVSKNSNWILKRQQVIESLPRHKPLNFSDGELLPFRGNNFALQIIEGHASPYLNGTHFVVSVPKHKRGQTQWIRKKIIEWYQVQALAVLSYRVQVYTELINAKEKSISIKNYRSRWGCCSSKGDLVFNWQIITFADELLNYVVAHEVCHLKEMNHSTRFYDQLKFLGFEKNKYLALMRMAQNLFII